MGQLTLKVLQNDTDEALTDLEGRLSSLEAVMDGEAAKLIFEHIEVESALPDSDDAVPTSAVPAWGIEIVEALIEALKGVRLQGAQTFALALEAKYFPTEEVEEDKIVV